MPKWAMWYLGLGFAWWLADELFYVNQGRARWLGIPQLDPSQPLTNALLGAETVLLWPLAAASTVAGGGTFK